MMVPGMMIKILHLAYSYKYVCNEDRVRHEALIELMEHHVVREWLVSVVNVNQ